MKTNGNETRAGQNWPMRSLILLAVFAAATVCAVHAQSLIGSPGAGWQTWSVTPISSDQPNLNDNGAPWWDLQWAAAGSNYANTGGADKNPGFCMTSTGDCVGMGSQALAPGALPFWSMPYYADSDTGGARDSKVYFHSTGASYVATLFLNATANQTKSTTLAGSRPIPLAALWGTGTYFSAGLGHKGSDTHPDRHHSHLQANSVFRLLLQRCKRTGLP